MKYLIAFAASAVLLVACGPGPSADDDPALITVFGEIGIPASRGMIDPTVDTLFTRYGLTFDDAVELGWQQLSELDQYTVAADFPAGGPVREFSGPLMRDVIALVRPRAAEIVVTAIDGYQCELALLTLSAHDVVLAIRLDGKPLPLGGLGPAMIVWPRHDDPVLAGMPDDDWVWGVFAIEIRSDTTARLP